MSSVDKPKFCEEHPEEELDKWGNCDSCSEAAYERSLSDFYGGDGPTTARERYLADHAEKRRLT